MRETSGLVPQAIDFERLFDVLPGPHMVLDRNLSYVAANEAYERATMRERADLLGRYLFDLFPNDGDGGRRLRASFERVFETGERDTLAYIPYDIPRPAAQGGGMEQRFWTAVHTPLFDDDGEVAYLLQNTTDVTDIVRLRQAASLPFRGGEAQLLERAREAEEQHQALLAESEDFRRLFQLAPGFFAVLSGPSHVFTFANDSYRRLVGDRPLIGLPLREALPEIEGQVYLDMLDRVYSTGKPEGGESMQVMLEQVAGEAPRETFLDFSYDAIRDCEGAISGVFVQGMDRTEAVKTQRRQKLLLDELNHRVKNTLASVQSIVAQTLRSAPDPEAAKKAIEARLAALSNAHNLLSAQEWASAELGAIIRQELAVFDTKRIVAEGPSLTLTPKASIAVAMVVHELATNAVKYGSLSGVEGNICVSWRVDPVIGRLDIDWVERGGPPAAAPTRRGFGTRMIQGVVTGELGGAFSCDYGPEGYSCRMGLPGNAWQVGNDND